MKYRVLHKQRGSALITAIVAIFVLAILAMAVLIGSMAGAQASGHRRDSQAAYDLAEAGFEHGYESLVENSAYPGQSNVTLGPGVFTTSVTAGPQPGTTMLTSTGFVISGEGVTATRSITGEISMSSITPLLSYAIVAKGPISFSGSSNVGSSPQGGVGNVYTNSSSSMSGGTIIDGSLTCAGTATFSGGAHCTGALTQGAAPITFPTVDVSGLESMAAANGTYGTINVPSGSTQIVQGVINGDLDLSGSAQVVLNGVVFVTGDVNLSGNSYSGSGMLVVQGTVNISGSSGASVPDTTNLAIVDLSSSNNAVNLSGGASVGGFIYAPNGTTTLSGGASVSGGLASNQVSFSGGGAIMRNTNQQAPPALGSPTITYWQDLTGT